MATDPRVYYVIAWCVNGNLSVQNYDTEEAAVGDYLKPLAGWVYDHAFLVSGATDGTMRAEAIDLPALAMGMEEQTGLSEWEQDANRYAAGGGYR